MNSEVKIVTCFAEDIGYPDTSFDDDERELKLAEFLEKYILFFNIEVQPGVGNDYYIARNISYVKKNDEFKREEGLNQIPVFSGDAEQITQQIFESKLLNNRFVGDNKNISNDDYDTNEEPQKVVKFARNEDELFKLNDSEIPIVKENINLCLSFSSTNLDDRMYFDLLDIVFKDEHHEDLSFISPSEEPLQIYDSNDTYTGALIPGYYKVIVVHENQNYYT
ncbi:hypothetical protein ACIQ57_07195 [Lysinibacillus xylanilyticus]|uniref:hypothetical protein n=1 Tax=Lysinibacillus xylanilyticus TaxID=582475 RepID=UPI003810E1D6